MRCCTTSNFWRRASDEGRDESAEDAQAQTAETDGEERCDAQRVLLSANVAFHRGEYDHHRVQDDGDSICN